ncbi:MAG: tetratricopeptide repeat protein [Thermodesulfobacteriota bacterium]
MFEPAHLSSISKSLPSNSDPLFQAESLKPEYWGGSIPVQDNLPAETYYRLGRYFDDQGKMDEALVFFKKAIGKKTTLAIAYNDLGGIYQRRGQIEEAIQQYQLALSIRPEFVEAHYNLGNVYKDIQQWPEASFHSQKALALEPRLGEAAHVLGISLYEQGKLDEAIEAWQKALQVNPDLPNVSFNLGIAYYNQGSLDEALFYCEKAIELDPHSAEAHYNLGLIHYGLNQPDEAVRCWQRTLQYNPRHLNASCNLGVVFQENHQLVRAMKCYEKALKIKTDFPDARWNRAVCRLLAGDFNQGWREYQWRFKVKDLFLERGFPHPYWQGEPLEGKKILLYAEQGFGDTFQFIRYLPWVVNQGGTVVLECPREIIPMLRNQKGIDRIIPYGDPLPGFDLQCPLLNLPLIFNTRLDTIPAKIPYLFSDQQLVHKWRMWLDQDSKRFRVGLVWAGRPIHKKDKKRSIRINSFLPLFKMPEVTFYSLQKGEAATQIKQFPEKESFIDLSGPLTDFSETAALIENLDLVITVDTAVAHLTGALGKPVWTLLPFSPDWRWMLDREDSPWYPTMKLFRQPVPGDWGSVMEKVRKKLEEFIKI